MKYIGAQGEVNAYLLEAHDPQPDFSVMRAVESNRDGLPIIGHSESGHHHVLERPARAYEQMQGVPGGMKVLYAILKDPSGLRQDAASPHEPMPINETGIVMFRISREYDPFAEQARQVAD